jgi:hypothetical protein
VIALFFWIFTERGWEIDLIDGTGLATFANPVHRREDRLESLLGIAR